MFTFFTLTNTRIANKFAENPRTPVTDAQTPMIAINSGGGLVWFVMVKFEKLFDVASKLDIVMDDSVVEERNDGESMDWFIC